MKRTLALYLAALALAATGCGHNSQSVSPSTVAGDPASYDEQDITVAGTAKNPTIRHMRRGTVTRYQLCDNACINVFAFGDTTVADGSSQTVTGRFHTSFGRRRHLSNVLVVGGGAFRMGGGGGSMDNGNGSGSGSMSGGRRHRERGNEAASPQPSASAQ